MDLSNVMIKNIVEVILPSLSLALLEQPALRLLLDHYSHVYQPTNPLPKRDTTSIAITNRQTMPPVSGFTFKLSIQGDHYERVWVHPSFIPEV